MRKILSFVAAFFFAASMMADPVVLPAVLDVSNVSFRSEGMPDFVIPEGEDYAGTYFDMGAHDSSNDTLLYAEWDVTIQPIKYNLAVDVYNTNGWRVQLYLLNQAGDTVKDLRYKGSSEQKGQFSIGSLDLRDLAAGNYKLRARAATAWSAMKLKDVIFAADYQGVSVALPDTLLPAYALLSNGASVTNNAIAFAPSTANTEYATWNVSFAAAGTFNVTIDITASNGHNYGVALLSADGQTEIGAVNEGGQKGDTGIKTLGAIAVPAAGNYVVKLTNAIQWSEAVLNNIVFALYEPEMKTIYCKMEQDWWKNDGAAIGCYTWDNDGTPKAVWPGDRMALVEGETNVWKIDLDVKKYHMCIFTRMNPNDCEEANCLDWGAKTADLTIPTDDKDLYTITSETAVWGDPGVAGAWSKYGETPEPELPSIVLIGGMNEWDGTKGVFVVADNKASASLTLNLAEIPQEEGYAFKLLVDGVGMGSVRDEQSNPFTFTRENNVLRPVDHVAASDDEIFWLVMDVAGEYTFTYTYADSSLLVTYPALTPAEHTYTVAGDQKVFGSNWSPSDANNDMAKQEDGTYKWEKTELTLAAGEVKFKVCEDHAWTHAWPAQDYVLNISEAGVYTITITFDPAAESDKVAAVATKTGDAEVIPTVMMHGNFSGSWADTELFTLADDKASASLTLNLAAATYEFGMKFDGTWKANGANLDRENPSTSLAEGDGNMHMTADVDGEYTFTYTFATQTLAVAYPAAGPTDAPAIAPAEPTYAAYQVQAVYAAKYQADCGFGEWGSGTAYTQEEFGKKFVTGDQGYFGLTFGPLNCSEMEKLHIDIWIAEDDTLDFFPIYGDGATLVTDDTHFKTLALVGQKWNSFDLDLATEFAGLDLSSIFQIKVANASNMTFWMNNIYFYTTQEKIVDLEDGYYLIGKSLNWDIHNLTADHKFAVNSESEGEFVLHYTLAEGDEFKVIAVANDTISKWYPEEGGNYVVDYFHVGEKDIYFRPSYDGGEGWHASCIFVAANENINPWESWFAIADTWNTETESTLEWDAENHKATINIRVDKAGQWRAQAKYHGPIAEEGKCYRVALKMKANNAIQKVTLKWQDAPNDHPIVLEDQSINLQANTEFVFDETGKAEALNVQGGNGVLVLDFGFAKAGDIIEIYDLAIEETECPAIEHTYTVAGDQKVFGSNWSPSDATNDMAKQEDGTYKWEKADLTLAAGEVQFKVCEDHAWTHAWPAQNYVLNISEAGVYTITITFDPAAESDKVAAVATKTGDAEVIPTVMMHGTFSGSWADTELFTLADDKASASLTLNLAAATYEFGMKFDGTWKANGANLDRENPSTSLVEGDGNMHMTADVAGEYIFTYTFATQTLAVTYPRIEGIDNTADGVKAQKRMENGILLIEKNGKIYTITGLLVK